MHACIFTFKIDDDSKFASSLLRLTMIEVQLKHRALTPLVFTLKFKTLVHNLYYFITLASL